MAKMSQNLGRKSTRKMAVFCNKMIYHLAIRKTYTIFAKLIFKTYMIMKITKHFLLLFLMAISFASCESNEEDEPAYSPMYTINWDGSFVKELTSYTPKLDIIALEYNDLNEIVKTQSLQSLNGSTLKGRKTMTASSRATKVVVKLDFSFFKNSEKKGEISYYLAQVYYLDKKTTIQININGESMVQSTNPIR